MSKLAEKTTSSISKSMFAENVTLPVNPVGDPKLTSAKNALMLMDKLLIDSKKETITFVPNNVLHTPSPTKLTDSAKDVLTDVNLVMDQLPLNVKTTVLPLNS